jgi:LPXTG-motif cell wall-anchored protein
LLFLYFCSGEIMNGSINGKMNENGWLGNNSWWWFSTLVLIVFSAAFGWLLYRKKKLS